MDIAAKIVDEIAADLNGRKGFDLDCLDEEIYEDILESWYGIIQRILKESL